MRYPFHDRPLGERQPSAGRRDDIPALRGLGRRCEYAAVGGGAERRVPQRRHGGRQKADPNRRLADLGGGHASGGDHRLYRYRGSSCLRQGEPRRACLSGYRAEKHKRAGSVPRAA